MDRGGCRLGNVDRHPVAGPCRVDCLHRALVLEARDLIALDREQRKLELEEARYTDLDEGAERARTRPAVTFKSILLDRRDARHAAEYAGRVDTDDEQA